MNSDHKEHIKNLCSEILNYKISSDLIASQFERVGPYDVDSFENLVFRMLTQLVNEIDNGFGDFLPINYNFGNEYGAGNLETDLYHLSNYLKNSSYYSNLESLVNKLVYYQIANGFWDRSSKNLYSNEDINVSELRNKVKSLSDRLTKDLSLLKGLKEELNDFYEQKKSELQQIERNRNASTLNAQEIATLLNQAIKNNEELKNLVFQQVQKVDEIKNITSEGRLNLEQLVKDFDSQAGKNNDYISLIEDKLKQFSEAIEYVDSKKIYFDDRNKYLDQLIGREVGASLFETFKQRKIELEEPVNFWKWAVPIMCIATVLWVFFLFKDFKGIIDVNERWQLLVLNAIKTTPSILLTFFTVNQYRKERNFQEEYAFKSAVALTVSEYANKLSVPENRDKLIMDAVSGVFLSPIERSFKQEELEGNKILESVKSIKEGISDLVEKIKK